MTAGKIHFNIANPLFGNTLFKGIPDFSGLQRAASGTLAD
jgi:hypothetical protein